MQKTDFFEEFSKNNEVPYTYVFGKGQTKRKNLYKTVLLPNGTYNLLI